ncbi:MAG: hypothetical protein PGN19_04520 [Pseudomonas oryzihabitans]
MTPNVLSTLRRILPSLLVASSLLLGSGLARAEGGVSFRFAEEGQGWLLRGPVNVLKWPFIYDRSRERERNTLVRLEGDTQVRVIETRAFQRWKRIEVQQDGRTVLGWVESYGVPEAMRLD